MGTVRLEIGHLYVDADPVKATALYEARCMRIEKTALKANFSWNLRQRAAAMVPFF